MGNVQVSLNHSIVDFYSPVVMLKISELEAGKWVLTWKKPFDLTSNDWIDINNFAFVLIKVMKSWPQVRLFSDFLRTTEDHFRETCAF